MATFEEQITALERVVEQLERGELSLDDSVRLFEAGVRLSQACKEQLDAAEGKIEVLTERGVGGKLTAVPMDASAGPDEE